MTQELFQRYRPKTFAEVVGQDDVVNVLAHKIGEGSLNHTVLFAGPSGCGKTTLARVTAKELGCGSLDDEHCNVKEINCADYRSIDDVRDLRDDMKYKTMDGRPRAWVLDEIIQLPKATQQAFLKILEDTSPIDYFFLCASDTHGLLPTFLSRCFQCQLKTLSKKDMEVIVGRVLKGEGRKLDGRVFEVLVNSSPDGNARTVLTTLEAVLATEDEETQLRLAAGTATGEEKAEFLAKVIVRRAPWADAAKCLTGLTDQQAESLRRQTLAYLGKVALSGGQPHVLAALQCLQDRDYAGTWVGLVTALRQLYASK